MSAGIHVVGNLYECPENLLQYVETVRDALRKTVSKARLNMVGETFHQFQPIGVTGVIILAESHISIHTWPETGFAAVDVFTCGNEGNAEAAFDILQELLQAKRVEKQVIRR